MTEYPASITCPISQKPCFDELCVGNMVCAAKKRPAPRLIEVVVNVTGDHRTLQAFDCRTNWCGGVLLRTLWSVGVPIAYAPTHWEEEGPLDGEALTARLLELARLLAENVVT